MSSTPTRSMVDCLSRDDLLTTLASIGVVLPPSTKISDAELSKKLMNALDAAQDIHELVPAQKLSAGLDTRDYPFWPRDEDMGEATAREPMRMQALTEQMRSFQNTRGVSSTGKLATFTEMRDIVWCFGHNVPIGHNYYVLSDNERAWGVFMRIMHVRKVEDRPLFVLLYKELHTTEGHPFEEKSADLFDKSYKSHDVVGIDTTALQRKVVLMLLEHNAKRLSLENLPFNLEEARAVGLQVSFIFPLMPPHMKILGKLSENAGCEICGNPKISRCVQCLTVAYCGPECQKADWKNHKRTCKSLFGGTWKVVRFGTSPLYFKDKIIASMVEFAGLDEAEKMMKNRRSKKDEIDMFDLQPLTRVPENIHSGRTFLIKIQISYTDPQETLLVYDRQRTFNIFLHRDDDPVSHAQLKKWIGPPLKMYRWAKRVSNRELEICLDRAPSPTPLW